MENCRGQTYDGAGAMAESVRGVSSRILSMYPKSFVYTLYVPHSQPLCREKFRYPNSEEHDGFS